MSKYHTKQLDIRRLRSLSIAITDFFRCFLSEPQRALLTSQRNRVVYIKNEEEKYKEIKGDPIGEYDSNKFQKALEGFEPSGKFDRELLLGVLYRHGQTPKRKKKVARSIETKHLASELSFRENDSQLFPSLNDRKRRDSQPIDSTQYFESSRPFAMTLRYESTEIPSIQHSTKASRRPKIVIGH